MNAEKLLHYIGTIDDEYIHIEKPAPKSKIAPAWYFAPVAACAVVALAFALLWSPDIIQRPELPEAYSEQSEYCYPANTYGSDPAHIIMGVPRIAPLMLNKAGSVAYADFAIVGHFWNDLDPAQLEALFPTLNLSLAATVHYSSENAQAKLFYISAYEVDAQGNRAVFADAYTKTEIMIAYGGIPKCVEFDYGTEISYVNGVAVEAGIFDWEENSGEAMYAASFKLGDISYEVMIHDDDAGNSGLERLTGIVNAIIYGGAADLSVLDNPEIPILFDYKQTLSEARTDPDFGAYVPKAAPSKFGFETAHRFMNQQTDSLSLYWYYNHDYIDWRISRITDYERGLIVPVTEREKYDMSLYSIPLADSVPRELREYVDNPVFLFEELTLDVVKARAYEIDDKGDTPGPRMNFSVLYGNTLVDVRAKGAMPEQIWEMLSGLG